MRERERERVGERGLGASNRSAIKIAHTGEIFFF